jgi:two-component system sensor histidine kinase KdpD
VVVALTGGPEGQTLIRRAGRIADRGGADLLAVHVASSDGLTGASPGTLADQRRLIESLGGSYHQVLGDDIADALIEFAQAENATQLVLGASRRSGLTAFLTGPGIGETVTRKSGDIDVHMVTHERARKGRRLDFPRGLTPRRRAAGFAVAAIALPLLTLALANLRHTFNLTSDVLFYLLVAIASALVGGLYPGVAAAVAGSLLLNYYFTPPVHAFTIAERNNVLALIAFVAVAVTVSVVVEMEARRTATAARASAESQILATLAGSVLRGEAQIGLLLQRLRETFGLRSVALLERISDGPTAEWQVVDSVGSDPCQRPEEADTEVPIGDRLEVATRGRSLDSADLRVLGAFAATIATALEQERLAEAAESAKPLAEVDRMRTALLAAVSHDLRSPLASAKAAVSSLRSADITWSKQDTAELLATADESLDRLHALVDNLLDLSRLQAGALSVFRQPVALHEVVPRALDSIGPSARDVHLDIPDDLPEVDTDPALLERVVANLTVNALRYSPASKPPRLSASALGEWVELRVVDCGPGIPESDWDKVFVPFQRFGDTDNTIGTGLGLALSRGLVEAMGGSLAPEATPGGGLTMVVSLPAVGRSAPHQPTAVTHDSGSVPS